MHTPGARLQPINIIRDHRIDSTERLKEKMPGLVAKLGEPQHFKEFYRFIFVFAKDSEQKCMPLEVIEPLFSQASP
jgi:hypothetical protein